MKTNSNPTEKANYIWNFVNTRRNKAPEMARPFETNTLIEFAVFVKKLTMTEAAETDGQVARWSKVTPHTMHAYLEDSLKRGKNVFKLEQEVLVIDSFLGWIYRRHNMRYKKICKEAITMMELLNRTSTWD